jgi:hypothetical protein
MGLRNGEFFSFCLLAGVTALRSRPFFLFYFPGGSERVPFDTPLAVILHDDYDKTT